MLDPKLSKRTEIETVNDPRGSYSRTIWIFECHCGKELRVQKHGLITHSGKCVQCVKRNRHPYQTIYNCFLTSVKRTNERDGKDVRVLLSFEDFLVFTKISVCHYCGESVHWNEWRSGPYNLDRKDNSGDYTVENTVVCCFPCNRMKGNFYTYEEFVAVTKFLKVFRAKRGVLHVIKQ
jgi:hypothetical protein